MTEAKQMTTHTNYRFQECFAKVLLERCVTKFKDGLILQDKPDLYCKACDTGVEVTDIMGKKVKEAIFRLNTLKTLPPDKVDSALERLEELGVEFTEHGPVIKRDGYINGLDSKPYQDLYAAITKKLERLNSVDFKKCSKNELLVFSDLMFMMGEEYRIVERLNECQHDYAIKFDTIYIVTDYKLLQYDLQKMSPRMWYFREDLLVEMAIELIKSGENYE